MPDNKDGENTSPSTPLWRNPTVVVPIVVALVGIPGTIISNLDKIKLFFTPTTNSSPNTASPSISAPNSPLGRPPYDPSETKENFFVIAGSSEYKTDLAKVPKTVRIKMGDGFDDRYRDIKICPSIADIKKYYLVIGSNLPKQEAEILRNQAKSNHFQQDTYITEESIIDFKLSDCEPIVNK